EAIKMAPVIKELQKAGDCFSLRVVVTAQHREMLDQVLDLFGIRADYDLNIMQPGQSLPDLACRILSRLTPVFARERPDLVMVHGDTATTFLGALAAFYLQIPVAHVEAGLRTYRPYSPFPEEMNRRLTGALAAYHFAPTRTAAENLLAERVPPAAVMVTGNTVIDALLAVAARPDLKIPRAVADIPAGEKVILVTTHRRENLGEPLRRIYSALRLLLADFPGLWVVFPVHRNPLVRKAAKEILGDLSRVRLLPPLEYGSFVALMRRADLVLTDSGGIQEEAPALGKPVLVLRDTTERPEAVRAGTVRLVGLDEEKIRAEVRRLLLDEAAYREMAQAVNPYGDGRAAERICAFLQWIYGYRAEKPEEFRADH
ncbi:MAG: UDP-N-acetylglucosamine 2-epimerase (non-hydrolyzing), partial [Firmicutes bacterium]|nr:UDP-N-acetylglucosamine 2-epimerase (non-hydrolyzing) [Bacillota bacterium]